MIECALEVKSGLLQSELTHVKCQVIQEAASKRIITLTALTFVMQSLLHWLYFKTAQRETEMALE